MAFPPFDWLVSSACHIASIPFRIFGREQLDPPERLLILKPCCIGDVLMATPVAAALQRAFPGGRIDWAVGPWSRPMVATNKRLGKVINSGQVGSGRYKWKDVRRLVKQIEAENYDTCLILDRSPVIASIPWMAQIPQRIGLDSNGRGFCHHIRVPVHGIRHEADIYLDVVRAMGAGVQGLRMEFYPTENDRAIAAELLQNRIGWQEGESLFIIHPAGGRNPGTKMLGKRWPPERFAVVINRLLKIYGGKAILLGSAQDKVVLDSIKGMVGFKTYVLAGEIDWGVSGALLEKATLCVGNDTGATHLSVAVGCKTVFIFGPSDPRRYGPYARPGQAAALWHPIPQLVHGVHKGIPKGWSWDEGVTSDEAWHAAQALMESQVED